MAPPAASTLHWGTSPTSLNDNFYDGTVAATYTIQPFSCTAGDLLPNTTDHLQIVFLGTGDGTYTYGNIVSLATF